eukprot:3632776-Rhodomonas_salina.1
MPVAATPIWQQHFRKGRHALAQRSIGADQAARDDGGQHLEDDGWSEGCEGERKLDEGRREEERHELEELCDGGSEPVGDARVRQDQTRRGEARRGEERQCGRHCGKEVRQGSRGVNTACETTSTKNTSIIPVGALGIGRRTMYSPKAHMLRSAAKIRAAPPIICMIGV